MKNKIEEIDELIKEALSKEEASFYDSLEEQNNFEMIAGLFKGKNAWFLVMTNIVMTIVFLVLFIYCSIQFFQAESVMEVLKWGFGSLIFLLGLCMFKIFAWIQMNKNAILREIKRLELLVMFSNEKSSD